MLKRFLYSCGVDVRLVSNIKKAELKTWEEKQYQLWRPFLAHHDVQTVIDVGANVGQFSRLIQRHYPDVRILAFEPLEVCHSDLANVLSSNPLSILYKVAVGSHSGILKMNQSDFSPCSSLLESTKLLGEDFPEAASTKHVDVPIARVDDCLVDQTLSNKILMKFDVQGFEIPAIQGAMETLRKASIVIIEVSFFRKLYEDQPLFHEVYSLMHHLGFTYMGNVEQQKRKSDGRVVEADAVFERF